MNRMATASSQVKRLSDPRPLSSGVAGVAGEVLFQVFFERRSLHCPRPTVQFEAFEGAFSQKPQHPNISTAKDFRRDRDRNIFGGLRHCLDSRSIELTKEPPTTRGSRLFPVIGDCFRMAGVGFDPPVSSVFLLIVSTTTSGHEVNFFFAACLCSHGSVG